MRLNRRQLTLLAAATALWPAAARAEPQPPLVIARGGASSERPEDTEAAFTLAIDQGADYLQTGLAATKDGVLVARRDNELSASTDVAAHAEFADRRTTRTIDGAQATGWFVEDFTLAELKTLLCRQPPAGPRAQPGKFDGKQPILTFQEVIDLARAGCVRTARVIGMHVQLLHPGYFAAAGLPLEERVADAVHSNGYNSTAAAMWVQSHEPSALKNFGRLCRARRVQLLNADGGPADDPAARFAAMAAPAGLAAIKAYADAVAPDQAMIFDFNAPTFPVLTTLVGDAHAAGLRVHARAAGPQNAALPAALQKGDRRSADFPDRRGDFDRLLVGLYLTGADGLACDFPLLAARARDDAMNQLHRQGRGASDGD